MSKGHITNQILKKIKYGLALHEADLIELFGMAGRDVSKSVVSSWLYGPDNRKYQAMPDEALDDLFIALENSRESGYLLPWVVTHVTEYDTKLLLALNEWAKLKRPDR